MPKPKPRKVGNPNNQGVIAFRGVSAETLRAKRLEQKTTAGQADRVVSYDPAAVRAAIEAQTCPFCGAGPYKVLAVHTSKIHGVDRRDLRELAGLNGSARICAPEFSERARQLAHEHNIGARGAAVDRSGRPKKYRTTSAGRAATARNLEAYFATLSPDEAQRQRESASRLGAQKRAGAEPDV